ncbi:MAG: ABC transporter substrate-binding protein [Pseudonocardiaceae bacterium]|nr:ABC transporter substrate-binding protein [Pseudonocardiaceae bacterium]
MALRFTTGRFARGLSALALVVLVITPSIGGCDVFTDESANGRPGAPGSLRIAVTPSVDTAALRIGVKDGLFDNAGLRVRLVEQPSRTAALDKLKAGDVDLAFTSDVAVLRAASSGVRLQLQGEAYQAGPNTMALLAAPDSGYTEPQQRPAPRIAVDTRGDVGELATKSAMKDAGVDPNGITFVPRPFRAMADALRTGEVDAAWVVEPYLTRIQKELGATMVLDTAQGTTEDFPMSSYAATTRYADRNAPVLTRFRSVLADAQRSATVTRVQQELPTFTDVDPTTAALVSIGDFPDRLNHVRLQRVADLMLTLGAVRDRLDVNEMSPPPLRS